MQLPANGCLEAPAQGIHSVAVAEKIIQHSKALGGISRITFQMNVASLPHAKLMRAIEAIASRVAPGLREELVGD